MTVAVPTQVPSDAVTVNICEVLVPSITDAVVAPLGCQVYKLAAETALNVAELPAQITEGLTIAVTGYGTTETVVNAVVVPQAFEPDTI